MPIYVSKRFWKQARVARPHRVYTPPVANFPQVLPCLSFEGFPYKIGVKCSNSGTPARLLIELAWARLGSLGKIQRNSKFRNQRLVKYLLARSDGLVMLIFLLARSVGML